MRTSHVLIVLSLLVPMLAGITHAQDIKKVWETTDGIQRPESAYYDAQRDQIYVSSIAGGGTEKNGNGWISILGTDGTVIEKKWVDGLNAPKGIRSTGDTLWVSDIDRLLGFDQETGEKVADVKIPEAKFLNDVAVGYDGTVYVSDMKGNRIYSYKQGGKLKVFAEGEKLESPNGLLVSGTRLLVCGFSAGNNKPGHLYSIDLRNGKKRLVHEKPLGNLDGLELDGRGNYVVTDWPAGKIYRVGPDGQKETLFSGKKGTADIGFARDHQILLLPYMTKDKVVAYQIGPVHDYQNLIDKSLSKWQTNGNWTVRDDGVVELKPGPNEEGWKRFEDYLTSKTKYDDFVLHVDYKIIEDGNSGIFFNIGNPEKPVSTGIEVQILDSFETTGDLSHHDNGGIISTNGASKNMSRPAGLWNHMTVIVEGDHLRVILNGEQVQDLQLDETEVSDRPSSGHISIQDHGLPFWVRNVKIRSLN